MKAQNEYRRAEAPEAQGPRLLQRRCACAASGESCERCGSNKLARSAAGPSAGAGGLHSSVNGVLASPGRPLDTAARSDMESRFGHDFSDVRIHTDHGAAQSASAVGATAYTVGRHIAFGAGHYQPDRPEGRMLLAHELAHVVQQRDGARQLDRAAEGGEGAEVDTSTDEDAEEEAEIAAEAVSFGWQVNVRRRSASAALSRKGIGSDVFLGGAAGGCGICYRGNIRQIGLDAHAQLMVEFEIMYPSLLTNFPTKGSKLKSIIKKGIPDLVMATKTGLLIGEIKPANPEGYIEGEAKLHIYEKLLRSRYKKVNPGLTIGRINVLPPPPFPFAEPLSLTCRQLLIANPPVRGVYGYLCYPPFSAELRKKCRCAFDPPAKDAGEAGKATNKGFGLSIGGSSSGSASAGIGISIYSTSSGVGNVGVGVSVLSDTAAAGTASAGVSVASGGGAIGSAGIGGAIDTSSAGAGTAGIGGAKSSTVEGAGAAGAGTVSESKITGAGVAGAGSVSKSDIEGAGTSGTGEVEDMSGKAGGGKPGAPEQSGEGNAPAGATTPQGAAGAAGAAGTATAAKAGAAVGAGKGAAAGKGSAAGKGTPGAKPGTGAAGTGAAATGATGTGATATGPAGTAATPGGAGGGTGPGGTAAGGTAAGAGGTAQGQTAPGLLTPEEMKALGLKGAPVARDQLKAALDEAARIRALIARSSPEQQALLKALAENSPDGQYHVPASEWVERMLYATQGMSKDDIERLKNLNWKPGKVTAEELRTMVKKALAAKPKSAAKEDETAGAKAGGAAKGEGKGAGQGAGKGEAGPAKKPPAGTKGDAGTKGAKGGAVTTYKQFTGATSTQRNFWFVNFQNFDVDKTAAGDIKDMTVAFFGDDGGIYTFQMKFRVVKRTEYTEKTKGKYKGQNVNVVMFDLEGANEADWDIAPEGQKPFVMRKHVRATFKGSL